MIFSGVLGRPIREDDEPDPVTEYGVFKARAEELVLALRPGSLAVRTSLIYRGDGSTRHEQLARDPAMSFYDDELRSPVQVGDLAAAILELAPLDIAGPLNVAGADGLSRLDFARLIAGPSVRGGPRPPGRPGDCRLDSSRARALLDDPASRRARGAGLAAQGDAGRVDGPGVRGFALLGFGGLSSFPRRRDAQRCWFGRTTGSPRRRRDCLRRGAPRAALGSAGPVSVNKNPNSTSPSIGVPRAVLAR